MKAAFAQAVLNSAGGAFDEVIDIEAVSGRRRLAGAGGGGVAWVMISYTGVARVLGTEDVASVGAKVQDEASVALTDAVGDGSFSVALQTADKSFIGVTVDSAATLRAIEDADYVYIVTTPEPTAAPSPRPTTSQPTAASTTTPAGSGGGGGGEDSSVTIIIIVVVIVIIVFAGVGACIGFMRASPWKDKGTKVAPAEAGAAAALSAMETANEEALET